MSRITFVRVAIILACLAPHATIAGHAHAQCTIELTPPVTVAGRPATLQLHGVDDDVPATAELAVTHNGVGCAVTLANSELSLAGNETCDWLREAARDTAGSTAQGTFRVVSDTRLGFQLAGAAVEQAVLPVDSVYRGVAGRQPGGPDGWAHGGLRFMTEPPSRSRSRSKAAATLPERLSV